MKHTFFIISLLLTNHIFSQYIQTQRYDLDTISNWNITIESDKKISSFVIETEENFNNKQLYSIVHNDTISLTVDEHNNNSETITSNLIVFNTPTNIFYLNTGSLKGNLQVHTLHVPPIDLQPTPHLKTMCDEPVSVDQSAWRTNLTEPQYTRIYSNVENIIIHHSASSNTATNYTSIVRNIYAQHTNVNGWSDIGYNYLIAPNGVIYKGRDPDIYDQDEVQGAHFCGYNRNTLGICILGNYETVEVSPEALQSLINLLSWKCNKSLLNPEGIHAHPLNENLNVIAGHRDGCSTACPGKNLYKHLYDIRSQTALEMESCAPYTNETIVTREQAYSNKQSEIIIKEKGQFSLFNSLGIQYARGNNTGKYVINKQSLPKGILVLRINNDVYKLVNH